MVYSIATVSCASQQCPLQAGWEGFLARPPQLVLANVLLVAQQKGKVSTSRNVGAGASGDTLPAPTVILLGEPGSAPAAVGWQVHGLAALEGWAHCVNTGLIWGPAGLCASGLMCIQGVQF